jgi:alanine dehydrogenase
VTFPYVQVLADRGLAEACRLRPELRGGVNCWAGKLTCCQVAEAHGQEWADPDF